MKRHQTFSVYPATKESRERGQPVASDRLLKRLLALQEAGVIRPGSLSTVGVLHDKRCPKGRGKGECRCSPSLYVNGRLVEAGEA